MTQIFLPAESFGPEQGQQLCEKGRQIEERPHVCHVVGAEACWDLQIISSSIPILPQRQYIVQTGHALKPWKTVSLFCLAKRASMSTNAA